MKALIPSNCPSADITIAFYHVTCRLQRLAQEKLFLESHPKCLKLNKMYSWGNKTNEIWIVYLVAC